METNPTTWQWGNSKTNLSHYQHFAAPHYAFAGTQPQHTSPASEVGEVLPVGHVHCRSSRHIVPPRRRHKAVTTSKSAPSRLGQAPVRHQDRGSAAGTHPLCLEAESRGRYECHNATLSLGVSACSRREDGGSYGTSPVASAYIVLSWNLQTDSISKKLVLIISRLSRLKSVLPSQMLMYIYTSIIQPKIDYAISIWGYTTAHNINKVQRLQNRAARILTGNFDYVNTRGIDLVKNLGLMNVIQRRDYFMLIMMFKSIHGLVPDYICDQITMQRDITVRTTRSTVNNNVHVPHILLECCKNAFAYRGPVLWNALPENIKKCETLNCFKKCVKLHVVE